LMGDIIWGQKTQPSTEWLWIELTPQKAWTSKNPHGQ